MEKPQHQRAFVLGITGSYNSGKTSIALEILRTLENQSPVLHVEVDHLGHQALAKVADKVIALFGPEVADTDPDGKLRVNRKALGNIVFSNPLALVDLEALLHPEMVEEVNRLIDQTPDGIIILNAAILFKMGLDTRCDWILGVTAPTIVRLFRALRRDSLSLAQAWQRIRSQKKILPQLSSGNVDIRRVSNWGGKRILHRRVDSLVRELWKRIEALL